MPPPPPPSKSYLLKFDSDSEDDDSSSDEPEEFRSSGTTSKKDTSKDDGIIKESSPATKTTGGNDSPSSANKKKRKNKKKKKKKKSGGGGGRKANNNADATPNTTDDTASLIPSRPKRSVTFDSVRVYEFQRTFYSDGVPSDGGWPLGMEGKAMRPKSPSKENESIASSQHSTASESSDEDSAACLNYFIPLSVDEYEAAKQVRLQERWAQKKHLYDDDEIGRILTRDASAGTLESRTWDFKFGLKNPLNRPLTEKQRHSLIVHGCIEVEKPKPASSSQNDSAPVSRRTRSNSTSSAPSQQKSSPNAKLGNKKGLSSSQGGGHRKSHNKSNSFSSNSHHRSSGSTNNRGVSSDEAYEARHVQLELEHLRTSRSRKGSMGCQCRKLHVYIPPPNAGKKAAHKRLAVAKVKEELRARDALPDTYMSRDALEQLLADLVAAEPCCKPLTELDSNEEPCPCAAAGIECQSEACTCWTAAAHHTHDNNSRIPRDEQIRRCGNPMGMYVCDSDRIDEYRAQILQCWPVSSSNGGLGSKSNASINLDDSDAAEEKKSEVDE